eukprot:scaffold48978_cov33-Tisochrysis_lutea.AAC.5
MRSRSSGRVHCAASRLMSSLVLVPAIERQRTRKEPPRTRSVSAVRSVPSDGVAGLQPFLAEFVRTSNRIMSPTEPPIAKKEKISIMHHRRRR